MLERSRAATAGARNAGTSSRRWVWVAVFMTAGAIPAWGQCTEQQKLTASDGAADDELGNSIFVSGNTVVVGAYLDDGAATDSGSAYVYVRSGGVWTQQAKLTASDAATDDHFGARVGLSGDTAIVGAGANDEAGTGSGSAYVFVRTGSVWTQQQKLTAVDAEAGDYFGISVAVSGDTAVVGAAGDDGVGTNSGSAYVFVRTGGLWTQQQKLTASDADGGDGFGGAVALSGDTIVIGAGSDDDAGDSSGSAYVFVRAGTVWTQQAKLTASDGATQDVFGHYVAVSGDTAVISADRDDDAGESSGSAYVFVRAGTVWSQQQKLTASDAAAGDSFGGENSVAVSGDTVVVGAHRNDHAGGANAGAAYVFVRSGGVWTQQQKLTATDAAAGDEFGYSVSVDGDTIVVGAEHDNGAESHSGSAYVFHCPENCITDVDCADQDVCTCDRCINNFCSHIPNEYGNADCSGIVEIGDVICTLAGYADITACPNGDVAPPCTGDDPPFIELADVLGILAAYNSGDPCACPP